MMDFQSYCVEQRAKATKNGSVKLPSDIVERWNTRVLPRRLHEQGERGASLYLDAYGKSISAGKCVKLALQAEVSGYSEMALGFWKKAYSLDTGLSAHQSANSGEAAPQTSLRKATVTPSVAGLPEHLQPGRIVTMQLVDAPRGRGYYIANDKYWGQPKRDGQRLVVVATQKQVFYQSRSTKLREVPTPEMDAGLREMAGMYGPFVLDGELYYRDADFGEHRTAAQAATANIELGMGQAEPMAVYAVFRCLFEKGQDLTRSDDVVRLRAGERIVANLARLRYGACFEFLPVARDAEAKAALASWQLEHGREGEVWFRHDYPYVGGKNHDSTSVRTKYIEEFEAVVLGFTPTTAEGRQFGAIEIGLEEDGQLVSVGSIGTGFTSEQQAELQRRFNSEGAKGLIKIVVASQGFTENGQVWHGRFVDFV